MRGCSALACNQMIVATNELIRGFINDTPAVVYTQVHLSPDGLPVSFCV
jgi:hypothetical protein